MNQRTRILIGCLASAIILATINYIRPDTSYFESNEIEQSVHGSSSSRLTQDPSSEERVEPKNSTKGMQVLVESTYEFPDNQTIDELMDDWQQLDLIDEPQSRYIEYRWQKACLQAMQTLHQLSPDQANRRTALARSRAELKFDFASKLSSFCEGMEAASIDIDNPASMQRERERINSLRQFTSYDTSVDLLTKSLSEGGVDALHESAIRLLAESIDEASIITATKHLIGHQLIQPPFPGEGIHGYQRYHHVMIEDVATALLCDRIGGCSGYHPFTLRKCLEATYGCIDPMNHEDAVRQLMPALEFQAFDALLYQLRVIIAHYRRS